MKLRDLTGQTFHLLTVIRRAPKDARIKVRGIVRCACGSPEKAVNTDQLTRGGTKSCGCERNARNKAIGDRSRTHGASRTREYSIWCGMKDRCENQNDAAFPDYGGRGIVIAPEFQTFEGFLAHLGPCAPRLSLDRIENNLGYAPGNVRWASRTTQNRNRRNAQYLTLNGRTQIIGDWAKEIGLTRESLRDRIATGWSVEEALTAPKGARLRRLRFPIQATNAEKSKARGMMKRAIRSGRLKRRPCEVCGNERSEGHHTSYAHPLTRLRWYCRRHHAEVHRQFRIAYPE